MGDANAVRVASDEQVDIELTRFLSVHTKLPYHLLNQLLDFGAVYARVGPVGKNQSSKVPRATSAIRLKPGAKLYARIHATPKRHRARGQLRVLYDDASKLVIVNKPAGLPVCATNDNAVECLTHLVVAHITHRLDIGTSGACALARSPEHVAAINAALRAGVKRYRVLTREKPPFDTPCIVKHWVAKRASRGRGQLQEPLCARWNFGEKPTTNGPWVEASLVVENVQECVVHGQTAYESQVKLISGRTHQIRLSFAAEGCPVMLDSKYIPVAGRLFQQDVTGLSLGVDPEIIGLCACNLQLEWQGELISVDADQPWWCKQEEQVISS